MINGLRPLAALKNQGLWDLWRVWNVGMLSATRTSQRRNMLAATFVRPGTGDACEMG